MNRRLPFSLICFALFLLSLPVSGAMGHHTIQSDRLVTASKDWPRGLREALERGALASGFWVNGTDYFNHEGDTATLNRFLHSCSRIQDETVDLLFTGISSSCFSSPGSPPPPHGESSPLAIRESYPIEPIALW